MQKTLDEKIRAVLLDTDGDRNAKDVCEAYKIPIRTFRRWVGIYRMGGIEKLRSRQRGPPKGANSIPKVLQKKIVGLKQKHPSWGARRIKHQYDLPCHWITVHRIIKSNGMLVKIKPKPQPVKRFQRRHVDSMWQGDTFPVPYFRHGKGVCDGVYRRPFKVSCSLKGIPAQALRPSSRRTAFCNTEGKDSKTGLP